MDGQDQLHHLIPSWKIKTQKRQTLWDPLREISEAQAITTMGNRTCAGVGLLSREVSRLCERWEESITLIISQGLGLEQQDSERSHRREEHL
jgi:hypothetical protein